MELNESLAGGIAQIQEGAKNVLGALASIEALQAAAEKRCAAAERMAEGAQARLGEIQGEVGRAEEALEAKRSEGRAANEKAAAFVKAGQEEAARLVDEAQAKRDALYKDIAGSNEALAAAQAQAHAAHRELDEVRKKIAALKEDALRALSS